MINPHASKRLAQVKVMQPIVINGILCKNYRNLSTWRKLPLNWLNCYWMIRWRKWKKNLIAYLTIARLSVLNQYILTVSVLYNVLYVISWCISFPFYMKVPYQFELWIKSLETVFFCVETDSSDDDIIIASAPKRSSGILQSKVCECSPRVPWYYLFESKTTCLMFIST